MPGASRITPLVREAAPAPPTVRHDVSDGYAQAAVFIDRPGKAVLWVEAATLKLHVTLSPAQVVLLAPSTVQVAFAPVEAANLDQCWSPAASERDPRPLDRAYEALMAAARAYHEAVTGRTAEAGN